MESIEKILITFGVRQLRQCITTQIPKQDIKHSFNQCSPVCKYNFNTDYMGNAQISNFFLEKTFLEKFYGGKLL